MDLSKPENFASIGIMSTWVAIIAAVSGAPEEKSCQTTRYLVPVFLPASERAFSNSPRSRMRVPALTVLMVLDW